MKGLNVCKTSELDLSFIESFSLLKMDNYLTNLLDPFHAIGLFLYPLIRQKKSSLLMFSVDIERDQWHEMG